MAPHFLAAVRAGSMLTVERTNLCLATTIEIAGDSAARKQGLLGRENLGELHALVIAPCQGVHTFGMRFPIDVVAVARDGSVVKIRRNVQPRRIVIAWSAFAIIELASGSVDR